ncbi:MAG: chorismate synthase [Clostridia bacterium]|jgi:chorismate synthase|nr:chorismate synthase [Clostridiales bacterium]MDK2984782.1 chorismate synthase [Clostridia bacterium]
MLRFLTAGESHGKSLVAIIEGFPAGVPVTVEDINWDLKRRQKGYGRGKRQNIERDKVEILSGVRGGETLGSPITLKIDNRDWENWQEIMSPVTKAQDKAVKKPRPGHADLTGGLKYDRQDLRDILERASARETAIRTAVGAVCKKLLRELGVELLSHVITIGGAGWEGFSPDEELKIDLTDVRKTIEDSPVRCLDEKAQENMIMEIDKAQEQGDTLGGIFEVIALGLPPGLGSHVHWDRRLEGKLAAALMSLNGAKAVEVGLGKESAYRTGYRVHDEIRLQEGKLWRPTNRAGGLEGGITTGEPLVLRVTQKPISTLRRSITSVHLEEMKETVAHHERSDVCAVPAAAVIGEALTAIVLAEAFLEKFGGDTLGELKSNLAAYYERIAGRGWVPCL